MEYKHQRKIIFFIAILVVLIGCSRPLSERETTATAPAESGKSLRISSSGVGQGGFAIISAWLFRNLKPHYPDRDMWLDYHVTGTAFRDGLLLVADRKAEITLVNTSSRPVELLGLALPRSPSGSRSRSLSSTR